MKIKQGIPKDRRLEVTTWAYESFKHVITRDYFFQYIAQLTNWSKSAMLVDDTDKLLGAYLLGDKQISSIIKITDYDNLKGIEGVLLAVDQSIRGLGWGNKLKDYPKILGVDYIWGQQFKTLNNIKDWLKRRILVGETEDIYITLEKFKKEDCF